MADYGGAAEPRYPCKVCGRQFVQGSLAKHENICKKAANSSKKRKVFDSTKQRVEGTDLTLRQVKAAQKKEVPPPRSNWRAKHEDFVRTVKAARGVSVALASGGPLPPPPPPSLNPDYIQCPYCSRRFAQKAAERHIDFCKEQSQRINSRAPPNPAAKAKQNARLQYQAPRPKASGGPPPMGGSAMGGGGSNSRIPAAAPARGHTGGARTGMGAPTSRGRGTGYQSRR
ncbi:hypothetical protein V1264_009195 [Littorina saxatilis]|uniref:C2HC/C3H-type domain-containing protein n=1 Tax=Littorina saxatilis TaxID=31220 RepID=A0AAN9AR66_9CAEN